MDWQPRGPASRGGQPGGAPRGAPRGDYNFRGQGFNRGSTYAPRGRITPYTRGGSIKGYQGGYPRSYGQYNQGNTAETVNFTKGENNETPKGQPQINLRPGGVSVTTGVNQRSTEASTSNQGNPSPSDRCVQCPLIKSLLEKAEPNETKFKYCMSLDDF
jgi:hypothetical protein